MASVAKQLSVILSDKKKFRGHKIIKTLKEIESFYYFLTDATIEVSVRFIEKLVYFCISNLKKHASVRLKTSRIVLEGWIASANANRISVPEACIKLLVIIYLDLSLLVQDVKISKAVKFTIEAIKLTFRYKLKTNRGKLLNFISRLRLSELYIISGKYEISIQCCETLLKELQIRLKRPSKSRTIQELVMTSITAFFRIGTCNQLLSNPHQASQAFQSAQTLGFQYFKNKEILSDLEYEHKLFTNLKKPKIQSSVSSRQSPRSPPAQVLTTKATSPSQTQTSFSHFSSKNQLSSSRSYEYIETSTKKYYNPEKLSKLKKILENENCEKIITADQFFFKKMTKILGIDLRGASPVSENALKEDEQKNEINRLRNRKLTKEIQANERQGLQDLGNIIEKFEEMCENNLKAQEAKMKSSLKTKVYKNVLRTINLEFESGEKSKTKQRLYFSPSSHVAGDPSRDMKISKRMTLTKKKVKEFNLEIEDQIAKMNEELKGSPVNKGDSGGCVIGSLGRSALKTKIKPTNIKSSIRRIFSIKAVVRDDNTTK